MFFFWLQDREAKRELRKYYFVLGHDDNGVYPKDGVSNYFRHHPLLFVRKLSPEELGPLHANKKLNNMKVIPPNTQWVEQLGHTGEANKYFCSIKRNNHECLRCVKLNKTTIEMIPMVTNTMLEA